MTGSNDTLYIKFDKNIEVHEKDIFLSDVAKMECTNKTLLNRLQATKLLKVQGDNNRRYVFSVLKIIEIIHEEFPGLTVDNLGATEFIITYEKHRRENKFVSFLKVAGVSLVTFLGAAFSIMAFNNDADTTKLFSQIYEWATGTPSDGFTILEVTYSIGLLAGIVVFFNHVGGRKLSVDPTPMEVQMRIYKDDINTTLVEAYTRKGTYIDVGDTNISDTPRS